MGFGVFGRVRNDQTVSGTFQQGMTFVFGKGHIEMKGIRVNLVEPDKSLGEGSRGR